MWIACKEYLSDVERLSDCRSEFVLSVLFNNFDQFLTDILFQVLFQILSQ
jgi:hypothetical protein